MKPVTIIITEALTRVQQMPDCFLDADVKMEQIETSNR